MNEGTPKTDRLGFGPNALNAVPDRLDRDAQRYGPNARRPQRHSDILGVLGRKAQCTRDSREIVRLVAEDLMKEVFLLPRCRISSRLSEPPFLHEAPREGFVNDKCHLSLVGQGVEIVKCKRHLDNDNSVRP